MRPATHPQGKDMPKGSKGLKRPADVLGNAVRVMRTATGEEQEDLDTTVGSVSSSSHLDQSNDGPAPSCR